MRTYIGFRKAGAILTAIYTLLLLFHLVLIIGGGVLGMIPLDFVWGGKLEETGQFIIFELLSSVITGICLFFTLVRSGRINMPRLFRASGFAMWIFFFYFALNTLGNALAETAFEKSFIALSVPISLLSLRLALGKPEK